MRRKSKLKYTRRQAIQDGQLVDVTDVARGVVHQIKIPIAATDSAWRFAQTRDPASTNRRAREVLRAATASVLTRIHLLGRTPFTVKLSGKKVRLVIEFHEADDGGIVSTIMVDHAQ